MSVPMYMPSFVPMLHDRRHGDVALHAGKHYAVDSRPLSCPQHGAGKNETNLQAHTKEKNGLEWSRVRVNCDTAFCPRADMVPARHGRRDDRGCRAYSGARTVKLSRGAGVPRLE